MRFEHFNRVVSRFEDNKDLIVQKWVENEELQEVLFGHDITPDYFSENFAVFVLEYFINVAKGASQIGDCPVMSKFLLYLNEKHITAAELFTICTKFRKAMIEFAFSENILNEVMHDEIATIFDRNFYGVLTTFSKTIKKAEDDLEASNVILDNYRAAIEKSSIVSITDAKGVITYANDAFCNITGYDVSALIGKNHNMLRHEDMNDVYFKDFWHKILSGNIFHDIIKNRTKTGNEIYLDTVIVPLIDNYKEIKGFISVRHDVTTHLQSIESALVAEEEAIEAKEKAIAAEKAKDDFLSSMSHEIRTPLNAILGFVTLLQKSKLSPKESGYLKVVENSGQTLLTIINDILDFAKIKSGKFDIDPHEFSPTYEMEQIIELFASKMYEKNIEYLCFIDPSLPALVKADAIRIKQIFSNFLSNAVKFAPKEGIVRVKVVFHHETSTLSIYVKDNGRGIKEENLKKIFIAFSQEEVDTAREFGGTGLGLTISEQLVHLMNGEIGVESSSGKGAMFYCHIPLHVIDSKTRSTEVRVINIVEEGINDHQLKLIESYAKEIGVEIRRQKSIPNDSITPLFCAISYAKKEEETLDRLNNTDVKNIVVLEYMDGEHETLKYDFKKLYYPFTGSKFLEVLKNKGEDVGEHVEVKKNFEGTILVAEDNKTNQMLISILLDEYGVNYDIAEDGKMACDMYMLRPYDLVLMDNNMPNMNGVEATHWILAYEQKNKKSYTPIVALTANASNEDRERFLANGMDDFLVKPIDIKELERVLERYLTLKKDHFNSSSKKKSSKQEQTTPYTLDLSALSAKIGLPQNLIERLVQTFLSDTPEIFDLLKKAIDSNDHKYIELYAHSIKGSAANLSLDSLQEKAKVMELAAKNEEDSFEYRVEFEALKNLFEAIRP